MSAQAQMTDLPSQSDTLLSARDPRHGHICSAGEPFARLSIGDRRYEVAETVDGSDILAFRTNTQREWSALDRKLDDGWVAITADILLLDPDVLFDFLQTHAVRSREANKNSNLLEFDTLGIKWSARLLQNRDGEVRLGTDEWVSANLGLRAPSEARERAIMLLLSALPNVRSAFEPHLTDWASRLAKGVHVEPIF